MYKLKFIPHIVSSIALHIYQYVIDNRLLVLLFTTMPLLLYKAIRFCKVFYKQKCIIILSLVLLLAVPSCWRIFKVIRFCKVFCKQKRIIILSLLLVLAVLSCWRISRPLISPLPSVVDCSWIVFPKFSLAFRLHCPYFVQIFSPHSQCFICMYISRLFFIIYPTLHLSRLHSHRQEHSVYLSGFPQISVAVLFLYHLNFSHSKLPISTSCKLITLLFSSFIVFLFVTRSSIFSLV